MEQRQQRTTGWSGMSTCRKDLRKKPTKAEYFLWKYLRNRSQSGIRFRRQHGIGPYSVDFYHALSMTVIELDGKVHENEVVKEGDRVRQEYLEFRGYKVIRFKNEEVFNNTESVLGKIMEAVKRKK